MKRRCLSVLQGHKKSCKLDNIVHVYPKLYKGVLLQRYKRFLADIKLDDGEIITAYCPNTGPMVGLLDKENAPVCLTHSDDKKRKLAYTVEMIQVTNQLNNAVWVGVHSSMANRMVQTALEKGLLPELGSFSSIQREFKHVKGSRIDFVLDSETFVEVKSVTLANATQCAEFPDTVSKRAQKHVQELIELQKKHQTAAVFLVQRGDCTTFAPSTRLDPTFSTLCARAKDSGVKLLGYSCTLHVDADEGYVTLDYALPLDPSYTASRI